MAEKKPAGSSEKKTVYETQESLYAKAMAKLAADELIIQPAYRISNLKAAAAMFDEVGDYLDAPSKADFCRKAMEEAKKQGVRTKYDAAVYRMECAETSGEWEHLAKEFGELGRYEDSEEKAAYCTGRANALERKRKVFLGTLAGIAALIVILAAVSYYSGFYRYVKGRVLLRAGSYISAEEIFESLPGFLDSDIFAERSMDAALARTKVGSDLKFGKYKWKVLERKDGAVRLIAADIGKDHIFYRMPFSDTQKEVTWKDSSLRSWLNSQVLEDIFTDRERTRLLLQTSDASANAEYGTAYPDPAEDYLTLLSVEEINSGIYAQSIDELGHDYWLRTPGHSLECAAFVTAEHTVRGYGVPVTDEQMMVRPVILVECGRK